MAAIALGSPHAISGEQHRHLQEDSTQIVSSPRAARQVFTICTESDEENSPRAPNPHLSRMEAESGLVSLIFQSPEVSNKSKGKDEARDTNSDVKNSLKNESDDDLILVTDKSTQTDDVRIIQQSTSIHQISSQSYPSQTPPDDLKLDAPHLQQLSEDELIRNEEDDFIDKEASEAPTLKVEYVGKVWDAYINDFLLGCDHIEQAAIYDIATGKCIACSFEFVMKPEELEHLANVLTCLTLAYKEGVTVNGRHYRMVLADGKRGLMAKTDDRDGCSACRTRTLIIIALHSRNASSRICNEELMRLGDFFWTKGL